MIVVDDPVATPHASTTIMDRVSVRLPRMIKEIMTFPFELRLPLAPYRFVWRDEPAVDAAKDATDSYTEERYRHADGTTTIIREYRADGSYHIMSDRGEIELIDNAANPYAADPVSVVRLPLSPPRSISLRA
jgi:hypothetical protein